MILHSVMRHVREQNWLAVGLDFLIVVIGVFIGIQVANWNDARADAEQQQVYLQRLHSDFAAIDNRLNEHFDIYERMINGAAYVLYLLRMSDADFGTTEVDVARLAAAVEALAQQRVPPPSSATYLEMLSEGHLSMMRSSELRDRLAAYDRVLDIMRDVSRMSIDVHIKQWPFVQRHLSMQKVFDESALSGIRHELVDFEIERMRSDANAETAIELLETNAFNSVAQRRLQRQSILGILALVELEMKD
jgi:hypothetical protein